jgi:hypothetical protein
MLKTTCLLACTGILCQLLTAARPGRLVAKESQITVQELVKAHLRSIGSPEALKDLKSRVMNGSATATFFITQGGAGGYRGGEFVLASEPGRVGMRMVFGRPEYPGEYIAYDGKEVTVRQIDPGHRLPLAEFIYRFDGFVREGLLGGTLSVAWPLLHAEASLDAIKYSVGQLEGQPVHVLEYRPRKNSGDMKIKLFFDRKTFRHLRTEYIVRRASAPTEETSISPIAYASARADLPLMTFDHGLVTPLLANMIKAPDSTLKLVEKFDDFNPAGNWTLPYSYTMEYTIDGQGTSYAASWKLKAGSHFINNGQIDPSFFRAQK